MRRHRNDSAIAVITAMFSHSGPSQVRVGGEVHPPRRRRGNHEQRGRACASRARSGRVCGATSRRPPRAGSAPAAGSRRSSLPAPRCPPYSPTRSRRPGSRPELATGAVVTHLELELARPVAHEHVARCRPRCSVGRLERVLDHAVRGQVDSRRGARARAPSSSSFTSRPPLAVALDQCLEPARPGWGASVGAVALAAEHSEQGAHLRERVATCGLDRRERRRRPARCRRPRPRAAPRPPGRPSR